jgi:hypothetical protein
VDARGWLENLRNELVRQKLPPFYVERLVSELSDHVNDFMEDPMRMDATDLHDAVRPLGLPSEIAASAAAEFRGQRFSGRHPVVAFVLLPIVSLPLMWAAPIVAMLAFAKVLGLESGGAVTTWPPIADWANWCVPVIIFGILDLPIVLSAAFFCRLASKTAMSWKWSIGACSILALVGGLAIIQVVLPTPDHQGHITLGFHFTQHPSLSQIVQFALPLVIGGWVVWGQMGRRPRVYAS